MYKKEIAFTICQVKRGTMDMMSFNMCKMAFICITKKKRQQNRDLKTRSYINIFIITYDA